MDLASESAYPTPYANSTILPLLLLSLMQQKNAPKTSSSFKHEYDYIIVGAGAAGSVVASRLSEIPCVTVLLLEAGKSPPLLTDIPVLSRNFWSTDLDWTYKTVPQKHTGFGLNNKQVIFPSGKGLGGSSMFSASVYSRANKLNYDDWAKHGAVGWSSSDTFPYFLKLEDNLDPEYVADGYHVVGGPMAAQKPGYHSEIKDPLFEAVLKMGYKFVDPNGHNQTGFYDFQATVRKNQRCSAAKAYLVPAENRTNLNILIKAFVKKVVIRNNHAVGVTFEYGGATHTVRARKEVIMSAGVINTAQLLMLSGIGPKKHLRKLKIKVKADLPVGLNFQDQCGTALNFEVDSDIPTLAQKSANISNVEEYIRTRTGPLAAPEGISLIGFLNGQLRTEKDFPNFELYFVELPKEVVLSTFGLTPKTYDQVYGPYENKTFYVCLVHNLQPKSRGTVRLNSKRPHDPPLIDPNYLADPSDLQGLVEGLKLCKKIGTSEPLQKVGSKLFTTSQPGCEKYVGNDDLYFKCLARFFVVAITHQAGTAKMGYPEDPTTVVDSQLRVKGIESLRVVDASVMPTIVSGNSFIPTLMVAEKASDLIKSTLNCNSQTPV